MIITGRNRPGFTHRYQPDRFPLPQLLLLNQPYCCWKMSKSIEILCQFPVVSFSIPNGSVVYCINFLKRKKLEKEFIGPYKVLSQNDTGNYILVNTKVKQLHRSYPLDQLKLIDPIHADIIWATELNGGLWFPGS